MKTEKVIKICKAQCSWRKW